MKITKGLKPFASTDTCLVLPINATSCIPVETDGKVRKSDLALELLVSSGSATTKVYKVKGERHCHAPIIIVT